MLMIFGQPAPLLLGQLLLGLINGAFYAMLSLGLAIIFGMLNIINFAHGALFMAGAFVAWMLLNYLGIGYYPALVLAPLIVGCFGVVMERTIIAPLYRLDHIYGLLLTFGVALVIEGLFRNVNGSAGPALSDSALARRRNPARVHVPAELSRLRPADRRRDLFRDVDRDREDEPRRDASRGDGERAPGARLRDRRAADGHAHLRRRRGARRLRRRARRADLLGQSRHGRRTSSSSSSRWW